MAYGYMVTDPKEQFRRTIRYYKELMQIALQEGYTRDEAIKLLEIHALYSIQSSVER